MDERHWRMLVRTFAGEASAAEREELAAWTRADPARAEEVEALGALWEASGTLPPRQVDVDAAWARAAERAGLASGRKTIPLHPRRRSLWQGPALRIAALLVLAVGGALLWRPGSAFVRDHVRGRTVATGKGERVQVTLSDGTRVLLGVESRLRWPRRFGGDRRDVRLEGAAYFEVAPDPSRPFSVYTDDAVTRVLGTRFTVRDYDGAEPARVAVTEGKVSVRPARAPSDDPAAVAVLVKGQAAEVRASGGAAVVGRAREQRDLAWTRGTIAFENAPVPEVVAEIGRWYDVQIQVPDPGLASRHLTISFENEPLETLLQEIAAVLGARVDRRGRVIVLVPASAQRGGPAPLRSAHAESSLESPATRRMSP